MKNGIIIGLVGVFVAVFALSLFWQQYNLKPVVPVNLANQKISAESVSGLLSFSDVAKHNTANDCWIIISDKAYSLQNVGTNEISQFCGKDATALYDAVDGANANSEQVSFAYLEGNVQSNLKSIPVVTSPKTPIVSHSNTANPETVVQPSNPSITETVVPPSNLPIITVPPKPLPIHHEEETDD